MEKPVSYNGNKPFIFISYSHRDSDAVWPVISKMINDGFRVWYDEGIEPGKEWDEFIANQITNSGYFIAFISKNYIASDNCKDELNFARDRVDNKLLIYLEDASLPSGMEMRLGRIQAIQLFNFKNQDKFFDKLYSSNNIELYTDNKSAVPVTKSEPESASDVSSSAGADKLSLDSKKIAILAVAAVVSIAAIIMMISFIDEFAFFVGKYNGTSRAIKALVIAILDLIVIAAAALTCRKMVFKKGS